MRTKRLVCLSLAATFACVTGVAWVGENDKEIKAGLQPGDSPSAFQTRDITGPNKGKSLCYV